MKLIFIKVMSGAITFVEARTIGLRLLIILIGFLLPIVSNGQNLSNDFGGSPSAFASTRPPLPSGQRIFSVNTAR